MNSTLPDPATFLSGDAGDVTDRWRRTKRRLGELAYEALDTLAGTRRKAARLARSAPAPLDVLVVGVYRPGSLLAEALPALRSERHRVRIALGSTGPADEPLREHTVAEGLTGGKFENLNRVLEAAGGAEAAAGGAGADAAAGGAGADAAAGGAGADAAAGGAPDAWTVVIDDDVRLPRGFLDRFVGVCEAFDLDLAQPAQTLRSHSAWKVTRRQPASLVRQTRFVEIGPVTAFGKAAAAELLPFPELRYGWGLDLHWAAVAAERGWRLGVVDALPVRHEFGVVAAAYLREDAVEEAARFLAERPYLPSDRAGEVVAVHRRAATHAGPGRGG
jgi:hypothetical protein